MQALRRLERPFQSAPQVGRKKQDITLWQLLRWAYLKQQVIAETGRSLEVAESFLDGELSRSRNTTDGTVSMMRLGVVGTRVDGKGADALAARVHPDAALMHDLVCMLPVPLRRTLVEAVLSDTVPEPYSGPVSFRPVQRITHGGAEYACEGEWVIVDRPNVSNLTAKVVAAAYSLFVKKEFRVIRWTYEVYDTFARVWSLHCLVEQVPHQGWIDRSNKAAKEFNAAIETLLFLVEGAVFERYEVVEAGV